MFVTPPQIVDRERYLGQIDKLAHSHTLRKAEALCKLLRYLAEHELSQPGSTLKEYQIATEVFGRSEDFDPQADSAVRVQAGRLRLKLLDYYSHEGAADGIVVEIPPGSYSLNFHERVPPSPDPPVSLPLQFPGGTRPEVAVEAIPKVEPSGIRPSMILVAVLSLVLVCTLAAAGYLFVLLNAARADQTRRGNASPALRAFWNSFANGADAPWVIFSNAAFVGRPETGMRYLDPMRDSRPLILDHYTGVGEVLAVHELDEAFGRLNHRIRVKRGSLFSLDDAHDNDLIFVGSPAENLTLLDLPGSREFVFARQSSQPHKGELAIRNVHPNRGEPELFFPTNPSLPLEQDYAIIALVHGLNPVHHVIILAGTTTIGTQAAVEYVCEPASVEELMRTLSPHGEAVKPFEALLRIKVSRGVPVASQLVAIRHSE